MSQASNKKQKRPKQTLMLRPSWSAYGGSLRRKRSGRSARPLSVTHSIHLTLRSTQARGEQSFKQKKNAKQIDVILNRFAQKNGIAILLRANVGNHLHLHIQLSSRNGYKRFIRAITGAIAQAITKASRLRKLQKNFWDQRPFTRFVVGWRDRKNVTQYIQLNQLEGFGLSRGEAGMVMLSRQWWVPSS